jgi:hypothetical protein
MKKKGEQKCMFLLKTAFVRQFCSNTIFLPLSKINIQDFELRYQHL